jgi:hypothetical protein
VREGRGDGDAARDGGGAQKNAAARFYASQFMLPDLPEVKEMR